VNVTILRTPAPYETISYWFGEDIRSFGSLITTAKSYSTFMALSDLASCAMEVVLNPSRFGQQLVLQGEAFHLSDCAAMLSKALHRELHVLVIDQKDVFREYCLHDGFSPEFVDNFLLPVTFDTPMTPQDFVRYDAAAKLLRRPPLTFLQWAGENRHLFID